MPFSLGYQTTEANGTVTMTGAEDLVFEVTDYKRFVEAFVDLSPMQAGDSIIVRQYMRIISGGAYKMYADVPYDDAQIIQLLWVVPKPSNYGLKLTIQQTAGANRIFTYAVFKENRDTA